MNFSNPHKESNLEISCLCHNFSLPSIHLLHFSITFHALLVAKKQKLSPLLFPSCFLKANPNTQTHKIDQSLVSLTLNCSSKKEEISNSGSATSSIMGSISPSLPSFSSLIGDYYMGCVDLKNKVDSLQSSSKVEEIQGFSERCDMRDRRKEGFPPPIPSLARTGNLSSHMPWVLRRFYTDDGRLILREERVKHHEYFQAHRCNGRLTMRLVSLDNEVFADKEEDENDLENSQEEVASELDNCRIEEAINEEEEEEEENELKNCDSEEEKEDIIDECKETQVDEYCNDVVDYFHSFNGIIAVKEIVYEDQKMLLVETKNIGLGENLSEIKCLKIYKSVRAGPSFIFRVAVPATRPVHG